MSIKPILYVVIGMVIYTLLDRLFLSSVLDKVAPGGYERKI